MVHRQFIAAAATGALLFPSIAAAEDETPFAEWVVSIEIQDDWAVRSQDRAAELNDLYATIEPAVRLGIAPGLSIYAHGVLEPVADPDAAMDRSFGDEGLYAEELFVEFAHGRFDVRGGKFGAKFGLAWDETPGVYGTDFAGDYELSERIGVEAGVLFGGEGFGVHMLSASAFFLDTSFLSGSIFTDRGRTRLADGGLSNTKDPISFVVTLDSAEISGLDGLRTRLSVSHQEAGAGNTGDETGLSIGGVWQFALSEDILVAPIAEYAHFDGFGAVEGDQADYLTLGTGLAWHAWSAALSYTGRYIDSGGVQTNDWLVQVSAGYEFDNGVAVEAGASRRTESGVETDIIGIVVGYALGGRITP